MRRLSPLRARAVQASRRRELASDRRAGSYAREKARRKQRAFARRQWKVLLVVLAAFTLLPAPFLWFVPAGEFRAFAAGGFAVSGFWCAWWLTVLLTGTATTMAGALGEQWSASELRKLKRRGWRLLNHVLLRQHDIDHIAVGPGGVVVVESKWTSEPWAWQGPYLASTVDRVKRDVLSVQGMIQARVGRGKVSGAVVIWGAGLEECSEDLPRNVRGVAVADAESIDVFLDRATTVNAFSPDEIETVWTILERQVQKRDRADAVRDGAPILGVGDMVATVATGAVGLIAGLLLPALAFRLPGATATSSGAAVALVMIGWKFRSFRALRWLPAGLLLGAEFWIVLIVATFLLAFSPLL